MSIDLAGRSVCVRGGVAPGGFFGDRPYYKLASPRDFALGGYDVEPTSLRSVIYLAQPSYDPDGKIAGVAAAGLSLDWLSGEIAHNPLPSKATVSAVDRQGTIIARYPGKDQFVAPKFPASPTPIY